MRGLLTLVCMMLAAGCLDDAPAQTATSDVSAADEAARAEVLPELVQEDFSWDGSVGPGIYACVALCTGARAPVGWDHWTTVDGITQAELEIQWQALPMQALGYGIATSCDGPCEFVAYGIGGPGTRVSATDLDPGTEYILVAWHPYQGTPVGGAQAGVTADFEVSGTVLKAA